MKCLPVIHRSHTAVLGLLLLMAAATGFWLLRSVRTSHVASPETPEDSALPALQAQESAARVALEASLGDLRLRPGLIDQPTMELPALLQRLQELVRDVEAQMTVASDVVPALTTMGRAGSVPGQLTLGLAPGAEEPGDGETEPASPTSTRITDVSAAAVRLAGGRERARAQLAEAGAAKGALEARLSLLGDGDPDRGVLEAVRRLTAVRTAAELKDELTRSHPDLPTLRGEIVEATAAREPWTEDPQASTALKHRRVTITREIEELGRTLERRQQGLHRLLELPTADQIEGNILALKDQRIAVARDRDRKVLLARLIRLADQRFRQERQPRVLRRAGEYLATITGSRYDRIITAEEGGREVFKLMGDGLDQPASLDRSASTGTREQAYLALRLAAVDELDAGGERLPVFVDEVFVNWDEERRARGIQLLGQLSEGRQVFVFTCHVDVAHALERVGGRVIRLEAGRLHTLEGAT